MDTPLNQLIPSFPRVPSGKPCGLKNVANDCFANSVVQVFNSIAEFTNAVQGIAFENPTANLLSYLFQNKTADK